MQTEQIKEWKLHKVGGEAWEKKNNRAEKGSDGVSGIQRE